MISRTPAAADAYLACAVEVGHERDRYREALERIAASNLVRHGEVVDIAREALAASLRTTRQPDERP